MMQRNKMRTAAVRNAPRALFTLALLALCASCAQPEEPESQARASDAALGTFEALECPEGYVGYRFKPSGITLTSQELAAQKGDEESVFFERSAITLESLSCGGDTATTDALYPGTSKELFDGSGMTPAPLTENQRKLAADFKALALNCNEGIKCSVPSPCTSAGAFSQVVYSCGANDTASAAEGELPEQKLYTVTAANEEGAYVLECPDEVPRQTHEPEVVCIPEVCHGRARRNTELQCVVDATKPEVVVDARFVSNPRPLRDNFAPSYRQRLTENIGKEDLSNSQDQRYENEPLISDVLYEFDVEVMITGVELPEVVTFRGWHDQAMERTDHETRKRSYERQFTCEVFSFDISKDDPDYTRPLGYGPEVRLYRKTIVAELNASCYNPWSINGKYYNKILLDYLQESGISDFKTFSDSYRERDEYRIPPGNKLKDPKLHLSYDLEDRTVWHKGLDHKTWASQIESSTPECAPNPTSFYQRSQAYKYPGRDAVAAYFDAVSYYAQRRLATMELGITEYGPYFYNSGAPLRMEVGTRNVEVLNEVQEVTLSNDAPPIPVDITLRPDTAYVEPLLLDIGWYLYNSPYNIFARDGTRRSESQKLYADIYVYPAETTTSERETKLPVLIGSARLYDGSEQEQLTSVTLPISPGVRDKFTQKSASSSVYVEGEFAAFDLFYCLRYEMKYGRLDSLKHFSNSNHYDDSGHALWHGEGADYGTELPGAGVFLEIENDQPISGDLPWRKRGCRVAKQPLIVRVDRFESPLPPTARAGFLGFADKKSSGDSQMSGANDNGQQEDCQGGSAMSGCTDTFKGDSQSSGNVQNTYFEYTMNIRREEEDGQGERHISADRQTKFFGFSLIDPSSLGDRETWPSKDSINDGESIEITIEPNWERIAKALQGSQSAGIKFVQQRIAGLAGLAVAKEFKKRWVKPPVTVVAAVTAGVGLAAVVKFSWGKKVDEDGNPIYPCTDSAAPCFFKQAAAATFPAAVQSCRDQGGRIAEMYTEGEAQAVVAALGADSGSFWVGAQLGYIHKQDQCKNRALYPSSAGETPSTMARNCTNQSRTQYSWLSTGIPLAFQDGLDTQPAFPDAVHEASADSLQTLYPFNAALAYDSSTSALSSALMTEQKQYVCAFDGAAEVTNFGWNIKIPVGAAVGIGLAGCVPTDDPGLCLGASLNLVSVGVEFTYDQNYHWFYRANQEEAFARSGVQTLSAPWFIRIFEGSIYAKVALLFLSFSYTIASYDGITIAEGKLYEYISPLWEDL